MSLQCQFRTSKSFYLHEAREGFDTVPNSKTARNDTRNSIPVLLFWIHKFFRIHTKVPDNFKIFHKNY